jgi:hypothetical protein
LALLFMGADLRPFLRLQSDPWLEALRDKLAADLLANVKTTSVSLNGKANSQETHVAVADLAEQLTTVLEERGLIPGEAATTHRMGVVRFT